ncbi:hypothetical protein [Nocardia sp. NPDC059229]|uniref:hypothetical protein n=1 Tax=Nocardia sp. NPDC059229 TaxID=3346778 RepID=UPI0036D1C2A7
MSPAPIPQSPVRADDKASEDAFAAELATDPCPANLVSAVLSIVQHTAAASQPTMAWSEIAVSASKGLSLNGIPQCMLQVSHLAPVATISVAAVTTETNNHPTTTMAIADVIEAADPTVSARVIPEPPCAITQELLARIRATGSPAQWVNATRDLDDTVQVSWSDPSITVAQWKGHLVRAQRRCADTRTVYGRPGDSPDWIIGIDAATGVAPEVARSILTKIGANLGRWVSGRAVEI